MTKGLVQLCALTALAFAGCSSDDPAPLPTPDNVTNVSKSAGKPPPSSPVAAIRSSSAGARADSLLKPTLLDIPAEASFRVEFAASTPAGAFAAELFTNDGRRVALRAPIAQSAREYELRPARPLERGMTYTLIIREHTSRDVLASIDAAVHPVGAIAAFEMDVNSDGIDDRLVVYSDGRLGLVFNTGQQVEVVLPGLVDLRGAAVADFNRDGRMDVAVAGYLSEGGATIGVMLNTAVESGKKPAFSVQLRSHSFLSMPVGISAMDIGRDGVPDLVALTFAGDLLLMRQPLDDKSGVERISLAPTIGRGMAIDVMGSNLLVSGTLAGRQLDFDRAGLLPDNEQPLPLPDSAGAVLRANILLGRTSVVLAQKRDELSTWAVTGKDKAWAEQGVRCARCRGTTAAALVDGSNDGYFDMMASRSIGDDVELYRFNHGADGFNEEREAVRLSSARRANAIRYAPDAGSLLIATESGLIELSLKPDADPVVSFDSRVQFTPPQVVGTLPTMSQFVLADFDGDGDYDVGGFSKADGSLGIWFNDIEEGKGLVRGNLPVPQNAFTRMVAVDANRDGFADLLLMPADPERPGLLLRSLGGTPTRGFVQDDESRFLFRTPANAIGSPVVADFNGDGFEDLFWPTEKNGAISFGDEARFFDAAELGTAPLDSDGASFQMDGRFLIADIFEGGRPDVIATGHAGGRVRVAYYRNRLNYGEVSASFEGQVLRGNFAEVSHMVAGQFAPGIEGVAAITKEEEGSDEWSLTVWPAIDAAPITVKTFGIDQPHSLNAFDVDRDGDADIALVPWQGAESIMLLINGGDGKAFSDETIASQSLSGMNFGGPLGEVRFVDLDGDGFPDILAQEAGDEGNVTHSSSG